MPIVVIVAARTTRCTSSTEPARQAFRYRPAAQPAHLQPGGEQGQQQGVADVERLAGFDEGQRRGGEHGEKPRQRVERAHDGATMHAAQPLDDGRGSGAKW
jgi:hypothetical protein